MGSENQFILGKVFLKQVRYVGFSDASTFKNDVQSPQTVPFGWDLDRKLAFLVWWQAVCSRLMTAKHPQMLQGNF